MQTVTDDFIWVCLTIEIGLSLPVTRFIRALHRVTRRGVNAIPPSR